MLSSRIARAIRSVEHLKRYTTLGMATDQGRTSSLDALAIMAQLTGRSIPETGVTLARPPVVPVALGAVAGDHRRGAFGLFARRLSTPMRCSAARPSSTPAHGSGRRIFRMQAMRTSPRPSPAK